MTNGDGAAVDVGLRQIRPGVVSPGQHDGLPALLGSVSRHRAISKAALPKSVYASDESARTIASTLRVSRATVFRVPSEQSDQTE